MSETDISEFDFWNEEYQSLLRPTPCLKFKLVYEPAPEYGANTAKGVRVLHQMFVNVSRGGDIWLPVEMES